MPQSACKDNQRDHCRTWMLRPQRRVAPAWKGLAKGSGRASGLARSPMTRPLHQPDQRCDVTPTCRHIESKGQVEHLGPDAGADELAEGDEPLVDLDPVAFGELLGERGEGLLGGRGVDVAPAVGDPVDVDVHGDRGAVEADGEGQGRDLRADSSERGQALEGVGDFAAVLLDDLLREVDQVAGLGLGERGPSEQRRRASPRRVGPSPRASWRRRRGGGRPPSSSRRGSSPRSRLPTSCSNGEENPRSRRSNIAALGKSASARRSLRNASSMSNGSLAAMKGPSPAKVGPAMVDVCRHCGARGILFRTIGRTDDGTPPGSPGNMKNDQDLAVGRQAPGLGMTSADQMTVATGVGSADQATLTGEVLDPLGFVEASTGREPGGIAEQGTVAAAGPEAAPSMVPAGETRCAAGPAETIAMTNAGTPVSGGSVDSGSIETVAGGWTAGEVSATVGFGGPSPGPMPDRAPRGDRPGRALKPATRGRRCTRRGGSARSGSPETATSAARSPSRS